MVPKTRGRLPKSTFQLSEPELADAIGRALQGELGASRRATKTVMGWTGVSDHTARAWLQGRSTPSGLHLVALSAHCDAVLSVVLRLTGQENVALAVDLGELERELEQLLERTRKLRRSIGH